MTIWNEEVTEKPAACAAGDGQSVFFAGRRYPIGVPVVLWNEPVRRYAMSNLTKPGAWRKDGAALAPCFNFYIHRDVAWDPFAFDETKRPYVGRFVGAGGAGAPYACERRVRYQTTLPGGERRWVFDTVFDETAPTYERTVADIRRKVTQLVIHHDGAWNSRACYQTLLTRPNKATPPKPLNLSVQFMLDHDGTVYQAADMAHCCAHIGPHNGIAIGVEINHPCITNGCEIVRGGVPEKLPPRFQGALYGGDKASQALALELRAWLEARAIAPVAVGDGRLYYPVTVSRPVNDGSKRRVTARGFVFGRIQSGKGTYEGILMDYTPEQHQAIRALCRGVIAATGIRPAIAGLPGDPYAFNFQHEAEETGTANAAKKHHGIVGHVHLTGSTKFDPNCAFRWRDLAADLTGAAVAPAPVPAPAPGVTTARHASVTARVFSALTSKGLADLSASLRATATPVGPDATGGDPAARDDAAAQARAMVETVQTLLLLLHATGYLTREPAAVTGTLDASTLDALEEFARLRKFPYKGLLTGALREELFDAARERELVTAEPAS
ncbi:MAG TPA: N-acetylmuramoyl-L-alanine amidase [Myxococcota bacterium]|jgi:hypothetical protein|nr:N-acetylmuramoyl-L-alanine amidase [Myxococcota bacterium]